MKKSTFIELLEEIAPLDLAEDWDNVGLLVNPGPDEEISRVLLCIDLTPPVLREAMQKKADFIIAYHPPIFTGLKALDWQDLKGRVLVECLRRGIAIYSPHTALDSVEGGVSDWLAGAVGEGAVHCPTEDPSPARIVTLTRPVGLATLRKRVQTFLKLPRLRVADAGHKRKIRRIALCPGAGVSAIAGLEADLLLTGEMRHHDVLDAVARGQHVILSEHTHTERGYLKLLKKNLTQSKLPILISSCDRDPLQ